MPTDKESGDDAELGFFFENLKGELAVTTNYVSVTGEYRSDEARFMARQGLRTASRKAAENTAEVLRADLHYGPRSTVSRYAKATAAIQRQKQDIESWVERQRSTRSTGAGDDAPAWDMYLAELSLVSELMAASFLDLAWTHALQLGTGPDSQLPSKELLDRFVNTFGPGVRTETDEVEASEQQVTTLAKLIRLAEQRLRRDSGDASALATFVRELDSLLDIGAKYHGIDDTDGGEALRKRIRGRSRKVDELAGKLDTAAGLCSQAASSISTKFAAFMKTARDEYTDNKSRKQFQSVQQATIGKLNSDIEDFCVVYELASQNKAGEKGRAPGKAKSRKSRSSARPPSSSKSGQGFSSDNVSEAETRMWRVIRTIWEPTADDEDSEPKEWIQVPDSDAPSASSGRSRKTTRSGSSSVASSRHANEYKHVKIGQNFNQPLDQSSVDYGTTPLVKPGPDIRITGPIESPKERELSQETQDYVEKMRRWFMEMSRPEEAWDSIWKGSVLSEERNDAASTADMSSLEDSMRNATLQEDVIAEDDADGVEDMDDVDEIGERYRMRSRR